MAISWNGERGVEQRERTTCGSCGSTRVMTVQMTYQDEPVSVRFCSECESREWVRGEESAEVDQLIRLTRRARDERRR